MFPRNSFAVRMNLSNSTAMLITLQVGLSYALTVALCFQRLELRAILPKRVLSSHYFYDFSKAIDSV
jgi:hypothetical protein